VWEGYTLARRLGYADDRSFGGQTVSEVRFSLALA